MNNEQLLGFMDELNPLLEASTKCGQALQDENDLYDEILVDLSTQLHICVEAEYMFRQSMIRIRDKLSELIQRNDEPTDFGLVIDPETDIPSPNDVEPQGSVIDQLNALQSDVEDEELAGDDRATCARDVA
jgi:hypothetical protein